MDSAKLDTFKLPIEWIERIFLRLEHRFQEKWTSRFPKPERLEMEKLRWRSGLYNLTADEIKHALTASMNLYQPPHVMEFYAFAKSFKPIPPYRPEEPEPNREAGLKALSEIRRKLHGKRDQGDDALPSVGQ